MVYKNCYISICCHHHHQPIPRIMVFDRKSPIPIIFKTVIQPPPFPPPKKGFISSAIYHKESPFHTIKLRFILPCRSGVSPHFLTQIRRTLTLRKIATCQTCDFLTLVSPDRQLENATFGTSLAFQMSVLQRLEKDKICVVDLCYLLKTRYANINLI